MILPDVNVLIYAFRRDVAQHEICRSWLAQLIEDDTRFGMSSHVLSAVVRISTNPRVFRSPSSAVEAFGFCDDILGQPHCELVTPGERHWAIFRKLCLDTDTHGARVTDAWLAALAIEWGCEWITFDRDYARFPGLKWRAPTL
jgi:toxin-antitoxin system PIN domain toxin